MNYYNFINNWYKLKPFYKSSIARNLWVNEMYKFMHNWARESECSIYIPKNTPHLTPHEFETYRDWRINNESINDIPSHLKTADEIDDFIQQTSDQFYDQTTDENPEFFDWVCWGASHVLIKLHFYVAIQSEPDINWQIIKNHEYTTIWDGKQTIFDPYFLALDTIPAKRCYENAIGVSYEKVL